MGKLWNAIDGWMSRQMSCRRFARHVGGVEPLDAYRRFHFFLHWAVCPFCRRYWRELREITSLQRAGVPPEKVESLKRRLKDSLKPSL